MSLSRCTECESIEGGFREPTDAECLAEGIDPNDSNHTECLVCKQCGSVGSYSGIPEHDDYDMER
jgi:hypothetical protein